MSTVTAPSEADIAAILDLAANHIEKVGYCKKYLYNVRQAENGMPLDTCEVDVIGALNVAVHGTPRHVGGDPLTWAAEQALAARVDAPSVATWCDYPGNGKQAALTLLRDAAARLREVA